MNNEINSKSPKCTDSEKEISTTTTESEDQTVSDVKDEGKSPDTERAANTSPSEQQVTQGPQTKDQAKLVTGPPGWPHPITPHPSMAWSHPLPPAQTVVVPPLSRSSRQSRPLLRLESPDRSVLTSRLDQLEREAKRLRRILGLREVVVQMSPLSDGEVSESAGTGQDGSTDSGVENVPAASMASKVRTKCTKQDHIKDHLLNNVRRGQEEFILGMHLAFGSKRKLAYSDFFRDLTTTFTSVYLSNRNN